MLSHKYCLEVLAHDLGCSWNDCIEKIICDIFYAEWKQCMIMFAYARLHTVTFFFRFFLVRCCSRRITLSLLILFTWITRERKQNMTLVLLCLRTYCEHQVKTRISSEHYTDLMTFIEKVSAYSYNALWNMWLMCLIWSRFIGSTWTIRKRHQAVSVHEFNVSTSTKKSWIVSKRAQNVKFIV